MSRSRWARTACPNTFVPGRNLVFLTFAAALAYRRGINHIIGGMCETDYSGYPDCRDDTIKALQAALNLGMNKNFELHTPLMWLDKAATWKLAQGARRGRAGRSDPRALPHLLSRRARRAHDWGLRLRRMPGLRACGRRGGGNMRRAVRSTRLRYGMDKILRLQLDRLNHAACGRRRGPRRRGSGAASRSRRRPCGDQPLQRREPMPVVGLAGVGIAGRLRALDLVGSAAAHSGQVNSPRACSASAIAKACASQGSRNTGPSASRGNAGHGGGAVARLADRAPSRALQIRLPGVDRHLQVGSDVSPHSSRPSNVTV
jgi:hypothetical protein